MRNILCFIGAIFMFQISFGQFDSTPNFSRKPDCLAYSKLNSSISVFFESFKTQQIDTSYLHETHKKLSISAFKKLMDYYVDENGEIKVNRNFQIVNIIPTDEFSNQITAAIIDSKAEDQSLFLCRFEFMAQLNDGDYSFSIPLKHKTEYWKSQKVGDIT